MTYLLDANTCVAVVRNVATVSRRCAQNRGSLHLSVVSITELEDWLMRPRTPFRFAQVFFAFTQNVALLDVTEPVAHRAAMIRHGLQGQGRRMGLADLLTAATALEHKLTLVTRTVQPFAGIPGLTVINWAVP